MLWFRPRLSPKGLKCSEAGGLWGEDWIWGAMLISGLIIDEFLAEEPKQTSSSMMSDAVFVQ